MLSVQTELSGGGEERELQEPGQSQCLRSGLEMGGQMWTGQDGQTEGDKGYKLGQCVAVIV